MGRNFLIIFDEKEGSTPIVRLLSNFDGVSIVRLEDGGWEPFEAHRCGQISVPALRECLELIYGPRPIDMARLNDTYTRWGTIPIAGIPDSDTVGLKMRFKTGAIKRPAVAAPRATTLAGRLRRDLRVVRPFRRMMFDVLARNNVLVFLLVRQNVFRWALSKYHGDGTGAPGHLQFRLAYGDVQRSDIPKIQVDLALFERVLHDCVARHDAKRALMAMLERNGIDVVPITYEEFVADPVGFFEGMLSAMCLESSDLRVQEALTRGNEFDRVHGDDISSFVINHTEVLEHFGDRYVSWR